MPSGNWYLVTEINKLDDHCCAFLESRSCRCETEKKGKKEKKSSLFCVQVKLLSAAAQSFMLL